MYDDTDSLFALIGEDGRRADINQHGETQYPRTTISEIGRFRQSIKDGRYRIVARGNGQMIDLKFSHAQAASMLQYLQSRIHERWDEQ